MKHNRIKLFVLGLLLSSFSLSAGISVDCLKDFDLGINPKEVPRPNLNKIKVKTNCRDKKILISYTDTVTTIGCKTIIVRTFHFEDKCGNRTSCTQTIVFYNDDRQPKIECGKITDLGCNPRPGLIPKPNPDDIWSPNECVPQSGYHVGDRLEKKGCKRTLTRLYKKIGPLGNYVECTQIWCWIEDKKRPTFVCPPDIDLGCNPNLHDVLPVPTPKDLKKLKVRDDCKYIIDYIDDSDIVVFGCTYSTGRTWIVTDECGNSSSCRQGYYWIDDNIPPEIEQCPENLFLGCLTEHPDIDQIDLIIATDNCGIDTIYMLPADLLINPETCQHILTITYVVEDKCGNRSFCIQQIRYKKVNNLPPIPSIPFPEDITVCGPIPPAPNYDNLDACGVGYPTLIASSIQNEPCNDGDGCTVTRTWIIRSCGGIYLSKNQTITIDCDFTIGGNFTVNKPVEKGIWAVNIAPNPGADYANIFWSSTNEQEGIIKVMDLSGKVLLEKKVVQLNISNSFQLDLSEFTAGMYLIEIATSADRIVKRWIKN